MIPLLLVAALAASPRVEPLPAGMRAAMTGVSWHPGCPVSLDDLRLVTVPYVDPRGQEQQGQLVVHADHAAAVGSVFQQLHQAGFAVHRVEPAHLHGGDDDALMARNITSAFNCRPVAGGSRYSEHSYGHALDLNPLWNPYVRGDRVLPPSGRAFVDRDSRKLGTIVAGDAVVTAFADIGWRWGGTWRSLKDYQHFSATGR